MLLSTAFEVSKMHGQRGTYRNWFYWDSVRDYCCQKHYAGPSAPQWFLILLLLLLLLFRLLTENPAGKRPLGRTRRR
jgi:hypothetical protein